MEIKLPIIIHNRDAHQDVLDMIISENAGEVGGIIHSFAGNVEYAKAFLDRNFYISISGPITYKNPGDLIQVVRMVPNDRLLIETDCPYLTPEPFRGKRNYSGFVKLVAEKIAEIKKMEVEEVANLTTQNAKRVFRIH